MSVLIKGMERPAMCQECLFECSGFCSAPGNSNADVERALEEDCRHPDCPLVPVPPHGLISREQILDAIRLELAQANACNDMDDYDAWMRIFDYVRKFPTIIEAEKE